MYFQTGNMDIFVCGHVSRRERLPLPCEGNISKAAKEETSVNTAYSSSRAVEHHLIWCVMHSTVPIMCAHSPLCHVSAQVLVIHTPHLAFITRRTPRRAES